MQRDIDPVFIFDVDGTLIRDSAVPHLNAMTTAIRDVFGKQVEIVDKDGSYFLADHHIDGLTNAGIFRQGLLAIGIADTDVASHLDQLDKAAVANFDRHRAEGGPVGNVIEGVVETLAALKMTGRHMGLLTGGTEAMALGKLTDLGLRDYFSFGGFGSHTIERAELFDIALADLLRQHERHVAGAQIIYVGDTPRDVDAGLSVGATVIGVATGHCSIEGLLAAGANAAFPSLAEAKSCLLDAASGSAACRPPS